MNRTRNLAAASGAATAAILCVYDLWLWLSSFRTDPFHNDFTFYYVGAQVGFHEGFSHLYDLALQQKYLDALGSGIHVAFLARYISPPPVAWLAGPFTLLPYGAAYALWSLLLIAALVLAWTLWAPETGRWRVVFLVAAAGLLPVAYGLQLGQPPVLITAGVAAGLFLAQRGHAWLGGAAMAVLVLKPQTAILVPFALLVAGRYRMFLGFAVTAGVLALLSVAVLGVGGVRGYLDLLDYASKQGPNVGLTFAALHGGLLVTRGLQLTGAVMAMAAAWRLRRTGPLLPAVAGLAGGIIATPYLHFDDYTVLVLAAWLYLRESRFPWSWAVVLVGAILLELEVVTGPIPVLLFIAAWLSLLAFPRAEPSEGAPA